MKTFILLLLLTLLFGLKAHASGEGLAATAVQVNNEGEEAISESKNSGASEEVHSVEPQVEVAKEDFIPESPNSCSVEELKKKPAKQQYCQMAIVMNQSDFEALTRKGSKEFGAALEVGTMAPGKIIFSAVLSLSQIITAQNDPRVIAIVPNLRCKTGKCKLGNGSFTVTN